MKVSIITVCYNSAATIGDAIQSVVSQNHPDIEHIIIDGGSGDDTLKIINQYKNNIAHLVSEPDKGIYDAMNKGIALASGEIVGILNSDDLYADENVVRDVIALFQKENCEGVYADLVYVDRENTSKINRYWKAGTYKKGAFRKGWMPPHPTFFVKRSVYGRLGNFTTALKSAADYEIMLRFIHKHEISLVYLPRVIVRMRAGGKSNVSLRNRIRANREDKQAWVMNGLRPGLFTLIRKPLSKVFQFIKKGR
ncbi:MAG TPA: glycosyl transferase [Flavobacteriales bacterium]|nr:glycosyl transferase [Flavobacteriales bacterium]HRE76050.1 glycosyltransferase family 2 protein [Flavobacteriales bacterium]HRJ36042.1 glycosyltransferase family 2 protein [Flavobacteriales bacterium]HRJ38599.1 glycosyltransferase family 2 protein [Flavobacteriales bacterium]